MYYKPIRPIYTRGHTPSTLLLVLQAYIHLINGMLLLYSTATTRNSCNQNSVCNSIKRPHGQADLQPLPQECVIWASICLFMEGLNKSKKRAIGAKYPKLNKNRADSLPTLWKSLSVLTNAPTSARGSTASHSSLLKHVGMARKTLYRMV